jgi:hypothetical protein
MTEFLIKNILSEILFENRICESLEDQSIVNYLYKELICEKLLYGQNLTISELRSLLHQKIIHFEFIKLNGEVRDVPRGTTMMKYIPQEQHPKGIRPSSPKVATFYDLEKKDWRSVSQRSKEIVLKQDEETGKPVVMVKDKEEGDNVAVKSVDPIGTINDKPASEPQEEKPEISKVKPIEKGEEVQRFYLLDPTTGATKIMDISAKDLIKKLKELGRDWKVITREEYENKEEDIKTSNEVEPEEQLEEPEEENLPDEETNTEIENINRRANDLDSIEASEV